MLKHKGPILHSCAANLMMVICCLGFFSQPRQLWAAPLVDEAFFFEPKNSIEISTSYEDLSPYGVYGKWKTETLAYYHKESPDWNWFVEVSNFTRRSGNGHLATVGTYKDWNDSFYTYTEMASGNNSEYLPRASFNQEFHFKFGQGKQHVWHIGGSFIDYDHDRSDHVLYTGLTTYHDKWAIGYQLFRNTSRPGSIDSYAHEIAIEYGKERQQLTTLTYSFGHQAYLLTELASPQAVRDKSRLITLNHRHWLDIDKGYFVEISRFNLKNDYHSTGISAGVFREF